MVENKFCKERLTSYRSVKSDNESLVAGNWCFVCGLTGLIGIFPVTLPFLAI
jgi:hypothetical protein